MDEATVKKLLHWAELMVAMEYKKYVDETGKYEGPLVTEHIENAILFLHDKGVDVDAYRTWTTSRLVLKLPGKKVVWRPIDLSKCQGREERSRAIAQAADEFSKRYGAMPRLEIKLKVQFRIKSEH
jgi:hypothetical protein